VEQLAHARHLLPAEPVLRVEQDHQNGDQR
jgi:hypothetical protein